VLKEKVILASTEDMMRESDSNSLDFGYIKKRGHDVLVRMC